MPGSKRVAVDAEFLEAFVNQGWSLLKQGREEEALEIAKRAVRLKETENSKLLFVRCVKSWSYFPGADEMQDILVRALRQHWAGPSDLAMISRGVLDHHQGIGPAIQRACRSWPTRLALPDLLGSVDLDVVASNSLLIALLESGRILGIEFERFLTCMRAGLLDLVLQNRRTKSSQGIIQLCCALARQCFINEYVFHISTQETEQVHSLDARISESIRTRGEITGLDLAVLAAYQPLHSLSGQAFLLKRSWPTNIRELLDQQIREPAAERKYLQSIPRLTPVADRTSLDVRAQYEDNPYPRWETLPPAAPTGSIDELFQRNFPFSRYRTMGVKPKPDILIAGCGTGHHSILFAQTHPNADILALDLSLASLCYAKHKTENMRIRNIQYAQADLLELLHLERRFDIISSGGVLHHLADPEQGWRILLSLLRHNGCMHIGLYSELARRDIVAAQKWLRARGYTASPPDIRQARHDLLANTDGLQLHQVQRFPDFYAMSECRDLLFPAKESRFTISRIKTFLDANRLEFLGFNVDEQLRDRFRKRFSPQREVDLNLWEQFEIENPDTFANMYQFWVQKQVDSQPQPT